ncbi:hypothetical protein ATANTOWER_004229 [Ataeniobius toweri]|uniref:Uncharacterized protein n=1 Tax=Ataeniobius toweri TaxID=208326 RepID=A0ABU7BDQ8_9TELE|nr:hypothetical protein [Ataeniobius toweri]
MYCAALYDVCKTYHHITVYLNWDWAGRALIREAAKRSMVTQEKLQRSTAQVGAFVDRTKTTNVEMYFDFIFPPSFVHFSEVQVPVCLHFCLKSKMFLRLYNNGNMQLPALLLF